MLGPVKVMVVGPGEHAARAFMRLMARPEMTVGRLPDVMSAATISRMVPAALVPDVIILESSCLATPDRRSLCELLEIAPVVLLGTDPHPDDVLEGLRLGARGHVDWPREEDERLEGALWTVLAGHPALSPLITLRILDRLHQAPPATSPTAAEPSPCLQPAGAASVTAPEETNRNTAAKALDRPQPPASLGETLT